MVEKEILSEADLEFCESLHTPRCLIECLFHDFDSLSEYHKEKMGDIRLYQLPLYSDECCIDFEATAEYYKMSDKQKFLMQKKVGDMYCFGARRFGKTLIVEIMDLILTMINALCKKVAFASVDLIHIRAVLDPIKSCFQNHPICQLWERRITGAPDYKFELKNNVTINSVNFNIGAKSPGRQWYGKHSEKIYIEEASLETQDVYEKRKDAISEKGAIFRFSGMTDFTQYSPAGKAFYALENQSHVLNLPQFCNPFWDEAEKKDRLEFYGGEDAINYRVFVKGEVIKDGLNVFDMERIREQCYQADKNGNSLEQIKRYEIIKERHPYFRNIIVVERPKNADRIFIDADIGDKVTEILVHAEIDNIYKYIYNIVLYNLTDDEQATIFKWLITKLQANVIGIDCGDGTGRAIYRELEKTIPKDNLVWYDGSMKISVGFELDGSGNVVMENNEPLVHQEFMSEWSVQHLQTLLYGGRCIIPEDYKFDSQFSVVILIKSGTRTIYKCLSQNGDHMFDAWKVFAIAQWLKKDFNQTKPVSKPWGTGVNSWSLKK